MILPLSLLVILRGANMVSVDPDMEMPVRSDTEEDIYIFNSMNINPLVSISKFSNALKLIRLFKIYMLEFHQARSWKSMNKYIRWTIFYDATATAFLAYSDVSGFDKLS